MKLLNLYFNKLKLQKKIVWQKNKYKKDVWSKFSFLNVNKYGQPLNYVFLKNTIYIELKVMKVIIKMVRRKIRRKKLKAWVLFCCNHAWFRKKKNSRMGKGKGDYKRNVFRGRACKPVLIFKNISKYRLIRFTKKLNMWNNKFVLFSSYNNTRKI